jgi:biotin-dependent carboxylase-like uncharacterized protein
MLRILKPGLQSTLQGAARLGWRHQGIPYAGPADCVSLALANRLVENTPDQTGIEITFGGFEAECVEDCTIAITGASADILISGASAPAHSTLRLKAGNLLEIPPYRMGARTYVAIHSGFQSDQAFGSRSTYLPAHFGGMNGRALVEGDLMSPVARDILNEVHETPAPLRPVFTHHFALRACPARETDLLDTVSRDKLFGERFIAGQQATRMGLSLAGQTLSLNSDGMMKSAPVFPGTIQCPPSGVPVVLLCDAQTTGGYPRIAAIARCDRHLLGQVRPGDSLILLERTPEAAARDHAEKLALLNTWLNADDFRLG